MKYEIKCELTKIQNEFEIKKLSGDIYEFIGYQNVIEKLVNRDNEQVVVYDCNMTHITQKVINRDEMISALIRLRYTQDAEFALINKGIQNSANVEYKAYRSYVALCKEQANVYF